MVNLVDRNRGFVEVRFCEVLRVRTPFGPPAPSLMFQDAEGNTLAVVVSKTENILFEEAQRKERSVPSTHQLIWNIITALDASIKGAFIYDLKGAEYLARILIEHKVNGERNELEAKPSDAITISMLTGSPIYVKKEIMQEISAPPPH